MSSSPKDLCCSTLGNARSISQLAVPTKHWVQQNALSTLLLHAKPLSITSNCGVWGRVFPNDKSRLSPAAKREDTPALQLPLLQDFAICCQKETLTGHCGRMWCSSCWAHSSMLHTDPKLRHSSGKKLAERVWCKNPSMGSLSGQS